MPLSGNSGRNDLACLNPISQGIRLVDAFVHQANGLHKHLYLILRLRLYHLVCPRLSGHLLQVDRPFSLACNDHFWPFSAGRLFGVAGQVGCKRWSARMQLTGRRRCNWVVKCDAITQPPSLSKLITFPSQREILMHPIIYAAGPYRAPDRAAIAHNIESADRLGACGNCPYARDPTDRRAHHRRSGQATLVGSILLASLATAGSMRSHEETHHLSPATDPCHQLPSL